MIPPRLHNFLIDVLDGVIIAYVLGCLFLGVGASLAIAWQIFKWVVK